jgi:SagB-type dehydrogenase family enzyme
VGDAARLPLGGVPAVLRDGGALPDFGALSALLYYTAGIVRTELGPATQWPYHRTVPSARCLFPTDVHYWLTRLDGPQPPGLYRYDAAHHALLPVSAGPAGIGDVLPGPAGLILSATFGRTAARYGDYAYRLCTQEAGMVAGNALLVAAALGWRSRIQHRFDHDAVHRLCGLQWPRQGVMALLPLSAAPDAEPSGVPIDGPVNLAEVLRRRGSGGPAFTPVRKPISLAEVERVVRRVLDPYDSDALPSGTADPVACHVWTIDTVDGAGRLYRIGPGGLRPCPSRMIPDTLLTAPNIHFPTANMVVYVSGDRRAATAAFGDRAFQVLNQEAGVLAQRVCVHSAAEGLAARVHNDYPAPAVSAALGLDPGMETLFQIIVGTASPTERYQAPVHLGDAEEACP